MNRKLKFATVTCTMAGWNQVGRFASRPDIENRFCSRKAAESAAIARADFGAPESGIAALVCRFVPGKGWKVLSQHDYDLWGDLSQE